MRRLLIVTNVGWFFLSHRLPLALAARAAGYDVHIASGIEASDEATSIRGYEFPFHQLSLRRGSMNPLQEARAVIELVSLYRKLKPDVVHHVSLKAVLYGGIAARLSGVPSVVNSLTGMGYLFASGRLVDRWVARITNGLLRAILSNRRSRLIVQNRADLDLFSSGLTSRDRVDLVRGSGVDLEAFPFTESPGGVPIVLLATRMLLDKGVREFLEAAEQLLQANVQARFLLAGDVDLENPASISAEELASRQVGDRLLWLGHRSDIADLMRQSLIVCLPSYHEGLPKVLLEAAASGRPMVASDIPGCREVVRDGETGLLVPVRDPQALARAIRALLDDRALCQRMGKAARAMAEAEFGIDRITDQTLAVYRKTLEMQD